MNRRHSIALATVVFVLVHVVPVIYAQQNLIAISSPQSNTVATEGQTITITVSADPTVQIISVITEGPLPEVQATPSLGQFSLTIPTTIPPGPYKLTAVGTNASGDVESAPVTIDVEPQFVPIEIEATPAVAYLNTIGDQVPLRVIGSFVDGSTLDVTHSAQMAGRPRELGVRCCRESS